MSIENLVNFRNKNLGILIHEARISANKTCRDCAEAIGCTEEIFTSYEEGHQAPSLPELENLAFFLRIHTSHFWNSEDSEKNKPAKEPLNLPAFTGIRHRKIGALLRQQRMAVGETLESIAQKTGLEIEALQGYEFGETPIPVSVLEGINNVLNGRIESYYDQTGPVGRWMNEHRFVNDFLQLPPETQAFICKPVNRPFIELALTLSELPTQKLRTLAESLLEITL